MSHGHVVSFGHFHPPGWASRPVRLFIPGGSPRPRPALVMFDGQNVFDDVGSYAGGWHAHTAVEALGERTFERPIIVAVDNGGQRRIDELGTHPERFVDALIDDLLPRVAHHHAITSYTIGGASLGGLAALYAWFAAPQVFSGAMVMSPSLWFAHQALLHRIERRQLPIPAHGRLYVDAGARERGRMYADAEHLCAVLSARGLGPDRLMWRPDQRGAHQERHWRRRLPKALRFLFRRGPARGA